MARGLVLAACFRRDPCASAAGRCLADASVRYLDANSAGLAMLGYSLDELRDLSIRDVILTEEVPRLPGHLASLKPGDVVVSEWRFQRKDGSSFLGEVVGRHLTDGRLLGILRDVTERQQMEAERLATLERQRDALVREVHHRIKNHLHGVMGLMHMQVSKTPELAPPMREVMAQINTIAGVYGLLGVAGGVAGGLTQIVALVASGTAGLVSVTYRAATDEPLLLAEADAVPVALVVNELVNNAVKHLAPPVPERPVQVTLEARPGQVVLSVKNGPARLPEGFDFARGRGLGTGLELVTTLLPREGAHLSIVQDGDEVCAELRLEMPVVRVA